jgi:hypothetical protein
VRGPSSELVSPTGAGDLGHEGGLPGGTDLHVSAEGVKLGLDERRSGVLDVEGLQRESRRCGGRRVWGVTPADQEWDHSRGERVAGETPSQLRAFRRASVTVNRVAGVKAPGASLPDGSVDVVALEGPSPPIQPASRRGLRRGVERLARVATDRGDDLEVRLGPEGEHLVVRALPGVLSACCGSNRS